MGRDHTLFSLVEGFIEFTRVPPEATDTRFSKAPIPRSRRSWKKLVHVIEIAKDPKFVLTDIIQPNLDL